MNRFILIVVAVLTTLLSLVALTRTRFAAATRVELKIDELRPNRTVPWPVTTGIPFPQGALTDESHCRLVDDSGEEQLLQSKVAATWDAKRSSIRWLTIDFIAQPGRTYALEFGPNIVRQVFSPLLKVRDEADVVIETGALKIDFSRSGLGAVNAIRVDLNHDGLITDDELVAGEKSRDKKLGKWSVGERFFVARHGRIFRATDHKSRTVVVESHGPVRACVRVEGWYSFLDDQRIVAYCTRYHLFAGLTVVKAIDEFRIRESTRNLQIATISLPLGLAPSSGNRITTVELVMDQKQQVVTIPWSKSTGRISLAQESYRHYGNAECAAVLRNDDFGIILDAARPLIRTKSTTIAERAGSWMQFTDDQSSITGSLRWFSQQFPKEWETTRDELTLQLWSSRPDPLDFSVESLKKFFGPAGQKYLVDWKPPGSRTPITDFFYYAGRQTMERDGADGLGINKHHEIWYHFGPADKAAEGREYGELADAQPLCLATGEWNVGTGVFGPLAARPNDSPYEAIVDRIFDLERKAQDEFGDYGWFLFGAGPHYSYQWDPETQRHYADPRRFEFHTYQRETQLWWNYLRSGERKFYDWCLPSENHWVDIAVSHVPTKYTTLWRGGAPGEATLIYPPGDWSIDSPLHYVRHHDTGEAWLRSASQFWGTYHRTLETTTLAYYLTGDERFNDVVKFWKDYWSPLAGVRSDTKDGGLPTHREQMWWQPTGPGEPSKSWAEMVRDYAPFQSGSRHQQTLFFNLATLYEHTWDPTIKQVLDEYAAAFLDPTAKNGVWQCQDHRLPANADSPMLAHYWAPALWKYTRATNDPRMPEILKRYFTACIEADPYGGDVGIYSNNQIAWGWWFTKNPQFLVAAQHELDDLLPNAAPLEKPEDLNRRIYNPYAPIKALAAVPRLIGILEEAKRAGVAVPQTPPLAPQRTIIAVRRRAGEPLTGTTWGWDPSAAPLDERGRAIGRITAEAEHRSHRQPFDRILPGYAVYRREFAVAATSDDGWCYFSPRVETGLLRVSSPDDVVCWGGEPVRVEPRQRWHWRRPAEAATLSLESSQVQFLRVSHDGRPLAGTIVQKKLTIPLAELPTDAELTVETTSEPTLWFRLVDATDDAMWLSPRSRPAGAPLPRLPTSLVAARRPSEVDATQTFVPGRFGQGLLVVPGRELRIPDEIVAADGTPRRLSDLKQGTLEFWVRRLWDDRIAAGPRLLDALSNGPIYATCLPQHLKLDDWTHVAVVWRPVPDGSPGSLVHLYFDGVDYAFYRSLYWEGYSKPAIFHDAKAWLKEFVAKAPPGGAFVLDDVRLSNVPRYVNLRLDFGRQQTFNPDAFSPPDRPAEFDDGTTLLLPLDGDLRGSTVGRKPVEARIEQKSR